MTSKLDPVELERLSKAATQGVWREVGGDAILTGKDHALKIVGSLTASPGDPAFVCALVNAYRARQVVPAQPSDPWAGQADLLAQCQQQASDLNKQTLANIQSLQSAQPSGNVVEAVARAIAETDGLDWDEKCGHETDQEECDSGTCVAAFVEDHDPDWARSVYRAHATAAITTYEAVSGVAKMRYRHKKRGTVYEVLGEGVLQCAANPVLDEQPVVIYRGEDGKLWVRGVVEFHDGRFEALGEKP